MKCRTGKVGYASPQEAHSFFAKIRRRRPRETGHMNAYQCVFCGQWHLGRTKYDLRRKKKFREDD